jgi:hypothetical protein
MYTNDQVDQETLRVLMHAAPGKDPNGRPKGLCAYQVCASFDDEMAAHFIEVGGVGGTGGGAAGRAFTRVVQYSLKRLADRGLVRHFYMDTRGLVFDIKGHQGIRPSYPVMAVYQFIGDRSAAFTGRSTEVEILDETLVLLSKTLKNTSGVFRPTDNDQASYDRFADAVTKQWVHLDPTRSHWQETRTRAVSLSEDSSKLLEQVDTTYRQIRSAQQACIGFPCDSVDFHRNFNEGFGSAPQERIDELTREAQRILDQLEAEAVNS